MPRVKKKSHMWRNIGIVLAVVLAIFLVYAFLIWTDTVDNPLTEEEKGYAGTDIDETDWYGGIGATWTNYTNPSDSSVTVSLPFDDFELEDSAYYETINSTNVTDFGGYDLTWSIIDEETDEAVEARGMIMVYGDLDSTNYSADDLIAMIEALIDMTGTWVTYSGSPIAMTVDSHTPDIDISVRKGTEAGLVGMLFYATWDCDNSDRTYAVVYGVAKDTDYAEWNDLCAIQEARTFYSLIQCH